MDVLLKSTELRDPYEPRRCRLVKRLRSELRDDLALVAIVPPLPRETYGSEQDISELILASRHEGESMFPMSPLPIAVHICRGLAGATPHKTIRSSELAILNWGEISAVEGDAS